MSSYGSSETEPLLQAASHSPSPSNASLASYSSGTRTSLDEERHAAAAAALRPGRAVEDDVLPETSALGRTLGWRSAYIIVISRVIGSGIFATPGSIVRSVGSPGMALTLWVVGSVIAACGLAISLEFGSMLPRSGGDKVYLEFTYRRPRFLASTLIAVYVVCLGFTASNCIVFSQYVLFALGVDEPGEWVRKGLAVGLLVAVVFVHGVFPRTGVRVQNVLGWTKVGIVVFMVLSGLYVVLLRAIGHAPPSSPSSPSPSMLSSSSTPALSWDALSWNTLWRDTNWNWGVIATSLFKVFYSYAGLDNANLVLNEVRDPVRTLRSVTFSALATACALYLLVNVAYLVVIPLEDIKGSGELIAGLYFERTFGPRVGRVVLPLAVALSAAGNVLVVAFAQEIARQGFLPYSALLSGTRPFGSPLGGLLVHFVPSLLVITLPASREAYSFILEVEGYPGSVVALAVGVGLLWLRRARPVLRRPFRAWLPAVFLRTGMSLALLAALFFPPPGRREGGLFYATYAVVGISVLLLAVLYWFVWTRLAPRLLGYRLEEKADVLDDGTTVTKLVRVPLA